MKIARNRLISILLIIVMVLSGTVSCFADESSGAAKAEEAAEEQAKAKEAEEAKAKAEAEAKAKAEAEAEAKAKAEAEAKAKAEEEAKAKAEAEVASKAADGNESSDKPEQPQNTQESYAEPEAEKEQPESASSAQNESEMKSVQPMQKKLAAELSDGTYKPEATFTGGSGRVTISCDKVIIKGGEATAVISVNTDNVTHLYMDKVSSRAENNALYNPKTGAIGENVYTFTERHVSVPVKLNTDEAVDFSGRTNAMSPASRWISYTYKLTVTDETQKISDDTTIPENGKSKAEEAEEDKPSKDEPKKKKTLKDGTYKVKATTDRKMFYLYPKEKNPATVILVKKNGKMTATITLTGEGYDYVYMGTPKQAMKAGKSKWIKYKKVNGYYTFKIPVSKLDKKIQITPHSKKYQKDYGNTLDPEKCPWRDNKWIMFYSSGAKKVKSGASITTKKKKTSEKKNPTSGKQTKFKNDGKAASQSKYKDDSGKSTSAVNNSTGLKDGVYTPDKFTWSGGSGRLAYIKCNKITVRGGKAFATIEFGSSKYDSLKANGRVYSKGGGGNSTFTIPVKLNANNTIIGRTTAMSQPHWVKYSVYVYKKDAGAGNNANTEEGDNGHVTKTKELSEKAPDLMGLEFKEETKVENAKFFKIYKYEQGITLIEVDQATNTALYKDEKKKGKADAKDSEQDGSQEMIEYDEDGKPIAKSQNEITNELYQNNVVNYLVVPKDVEIPAGLDKDCIIIQQPVEKGYIAADAVLSDMSELGVLESIKTLGMEEKDVKDEQLRKAMDEDKVKALGSYEKPDYAEIIKSKTDLAIFPDDVLPEKVKNRKATEGKTVDKAKKESEEKKAALEVLQRRFSALAVPMLVDRSADEKDTYAEAEWIKVYGVIYGQEEKAEAAYKAFTDKNKNEKLKQN